MYNPLKSALVAVPALAAALAVAPGAMGAPAPVSATVETCHRAADQADRFAVFGAEMRSVPGAARMGVRFDLQRQRDGRRYRTIRAPGLGRWQRSEPGVDIFRYRKQVTNLSAPANYRAVVRYRWYDATGDVMRRARRSTASCKQTDPRADLSVRDLVVEPGPTADRVRYVITLRNDGRRHATAFDAVLLLDGERVGSVSVPDLAGRSEQAVAIEARRCEFRSRLRVVVDGARRVDESRENNNATRFSCPL